MDLNYLLSMFTTTDWAIFMVLFLCGATVVIGYAIFKEDEE